MPSSTRAATAHHEAGHAVAAIMKQVSFKLVTINPDHLHGSSGHVQFLRFGEGFEALHRGAVVVLAGEVAQRRYSPRSARKHHGSGDRSVVADHALKMAGSARVADLHVRLWQQQAVELVEARWEQVTRVAAALLEHRILTQAECLEIAVRRS